MGRIKILPTAVVDQIAALFGGPVDAHALHRLRVILRAIDRPLERRRKVRARGDVGGEQIDGHDEIGYRHIQRGLTRSDVTQPVVSVERKGTNRVV